MAVGPPHPALRATFPASGEVIVKARLFARLREQVGAELETIELPAGSTVTDVYEALRRAHPALEPDRAAVRAALNQEFADWGAAVEDGDEVAFIPPVSGGRMEWACCSS